MTDTTVTGQAATASTTGSSHLTSRPTVRSSHRLIVTRSQDDRLIAAPPG